ncbi:hypothetical protein WK78_29735 [Burkholderia cepacia]|uniref:hypothetical protein n=1 Tax=Burkholderia cepacia TaxID=292 RepID=UPI0007551E89|nr:hypothetical protein [Burkholderia cepacia]KVV20461.1 hypothetical protein WK78_29735 [Burkholderia cepacia]
MNKQPLKVVLLDDDYARASSWANDIHAAQGCDAVAPPVDQVRDLIGVLFRRRKLGRQDGNIWTVPCDLLDSSDILIIDYDLQNLDQDGEWTTGSEVAYAARIASKAKSIVVVNQRGTNRFDLTMTKGAESRADLDIGSVQLTNPGLWASSGFEGYRPWAWPNLLKEPARAEQSVAFVAEHFDEPVLAALGFNDDAATGRSLRPELWGKLCTQTNMTFRQLVIPEDESSAVHVLFADRHVYQNDDPLAAAVAAAIVRRWLEKWVLPNQDVLADAPHFAVRFPWLMKSPAEEAQWHLLETLESPEAFVDDAAVFKFTPECFFSRPVFWADAVDVSDAVQRPDEFDYEAIPELVFREDVSNFGAPEISRDFPSQVSSIDNRRWISEPSLEPQREGSQDVRTVVFEPQSLLLG